MSEKKIVGYCNNCGGPLYEGNKFCTQCGQTVTNVETKTSVENNEKVSTASVNTGTFQQDNMETNLNGLILSENEKLVRQYHVASTRRPVANGFLTVTNKRVIFHADGLGLFKSRLTDEISLENISGLECYFGTNFNFLLLIIGIIIAFAGLAQLFAKYGSSGSRFLGLIMALIGAYLVYLSYRKSFKLLIYSKQCSPSPITVGEGLRTIRGNTVVYALASQPTADAIRMLNELGALVNDLQTMGDKAIDKWTA